MNLKVIEIIAFELSTQSLLPTAFLFEGQTVYFATGAGNPTHLPQSPIINLIQGVYEFEPDRARKILRNRIFSVLPTATAMCQGMVKVAAKRLTCGIRPISGSLPFQVYYRDVTPPENQLSKSRIENPSFELQIQSARRPSMSPKDYLNLAYQLAASVPRSGVKYQDSRSIASLLVQALPGNPEPRILAYGINSTSSNKTLHAEVNLIQSFFQKTGNPLPPYSRIYTTLKPCKMCAAMIWHCASHLESLEVYYAEEDTGPFARETLLSPQTPDRQRFAQNPTEASLIIERYYPL